MSTLSDADRVVVARTLNRLLRPPESAASAPVVPPSAAPLAPVRGERPRAVTAGRNVCVYCGSAARKAALACRAHADLPRLDPHYSALVTTPTTSRPPPPIYLSR